MKKKLGLLATIFVSIGCAQYEPDPLDPVAEREVLHSRLKIDFPTPPASEFASQRFPFATQVEPGNGLDLDEANSLALFYGPRLTAARRRLELHQAELLRAGLLENPELFVGPRLTENDQNIILPASLSMTIPLGGSLGAEKQRAEAELEAARSELLMVEAEVLVGLRIAYIELASLRRQHEVFLSARDASQATFKKSQQLYKAGELDQVALCLASLQLAENRRQMIANDAAIRAKSIFILEQIGVLPDAAVKVNARADLLASWPETKSATSDLVLSHPALRALESRYLASEANLELEVAKQYPTLRLGPEFESDGSQNSFGLGVSMSLPIFNQNRGGIAHAEATRRAGRDAWQAMLLQLTTKKARAESRLSLARQILSDIEGNTQTLAKQAQSALARRRERGQSSLIEDLAASHAIANHGLDYIKALESRAIEGLKVSWFSGAIFPPQEASELESEESTK